MSSEDVINSSKNYKCLSLHYGISNVTEAFFVDVRIFTIPTRILSMMMCIQNFVSFCQFVLKVLSKNRILKSIKGSYSVANL